MSLTKNDVLHTAKLARLHLDPDEAEQFTVQLDRIMGFIDKLNEADVEGVEPTTGVLEDRNTVRKDIAERTFTPEDLLRTAPDRSENFFRVPPVIEGE
jgi:aspartyl-tRNA(Asn)/glutamyl-tRNA(Gln) amidotransferase subunit C